MHARVGPRGVGEGREASPGSVQYGCGGGASTPGQWQECALRRVARQPGSWCPLRRNNAGATGAEGSTGAYRVRWVGPCVRIRGVYWQGPEAYGQAQRREVARRTRRGEGAPRYARVLEPNA